MSNAFMLSDEVEKQLDSLAWRFNKSYLQVIEFLITDRYNASDVKKNKARAEKHWKEYRANLPDNLPDDFMEILANACVEFYYHGWIDFQTRHGDNKFIIAKEDTSEDSSGST